MMENIPFLPPELWDLILWEIDIKILDKFRPLSRFLNEIILNNRILNLELQLCRGGVYNDTSLIKFKWACEEGKLKVAKFILENETIKIPKIIEGFYGGTMGGFFCRILCNLTISNEDRMGFYKLLAESFVNRTNICEVIMGILLTISVKILQYDNFYAIPIKDRERLLTNLFKVLFDHVEESASLGLIGMFSEDIMQSKLNEQIFIVSFTILYDEKFLELCDLFIDKFKPSLGPDNENIGQVINIFNTINQGRYTIDFEEKMRSAINYVNEYNSKKGPGLKEI